MPASQNSQPNVSIGGDGDLLWGTRSAWEIAEGLVSQPSVEDCRAADLPGMGGGRHRGCSSGHGWDIMWGLINQPGVGDVRGVQLTGVHGGWPGSIICQACANKENVIGLSVLSDCS